MNRLYEKPYFTDNKGKPICQHDSLSVLIVNDITDYQLIVDSLFIHSSYSPSNSIAISISSNFIHFNHSENKVFFNMKEEEIRIVFPFEL